MKQESNGDIETMITRATELFSRLQNQSEDGLRNFIKQGMPVDAGVSHSEVRKNAHSLIIHNMDYEFLRAKLRTLFAENVIFDDKQIENLKKKYGLNNLQARAVYFAEILILCEYYEEKAVEYFVNLVEDFLENFIDKVQPQLLDKCLKKFLRDFSEDQDKKQVNVDISTTIGSSLKNSRVLVKNPNVGRPLKSISEKATTEAEISQTIMELLSEKLNKITDSFEVDSQLVITKKELCEKVGVSRPTINKRFEELSLDFSELVKKRVKQFIEQNSESNAVLNDYVKKMKKVF